MGEIIENNNMKRQPGHYWVKYKGKWIIALWEQLTEKLGSFQIGNPEENEMPVHGDFEEIDEQRIERTKADFL